MPDLMQYHPFRENDDDPPFQPQMTTPLPLPGEYVVLQLNPAAMARHLGKPEMIRELEKLETKKYIAVVSHYYEELSPLKPWHMAHVFLYYDVTAPEAPIHEAAEVHSVNVGASEDAEATPLLQKRAVIAPTARKYKPKQLVQNLVVRIRTRLCQLPRKDPLEMPRVIYKEVNKHILKTVEHAQDERNLLQTTVECRHAFLARAPKFPLQVWPNSAKEVVYDPTEWETGTKLQRLCLLPHCDYTLGTGAGDRISAGKNMIDEQTQIISILRSAIPEMPLKARIPTLWTEVDPRDYYLEMRLPYNIRSMMRNHGTPDWIRERNERAKKRVEQASQGWFTSFFQQANGFRPTSEVEALMKASQDVERPAGSLLVFAPPGIDESIFDEPPTQPERTLIQWIWDVLDDIKAALAELWWTPSSYPDVPEDTPYIPFSEWDRLVEAGIADPKAPYEVRKRTEQYEWFEMDW